METIMGLFRGHPKTMLITVLFIFTVLVGGISNAVSYNAGTSQGQQTHCTARRLKHDPDHHFPGRTD